MKRKALLLLLNFATSMLIADDIHSLLNKGKGDGCKIAFLKKEQKKCSDQKNLSTLKENKYSRTTPPSSKASYNKQTKIRNQLRKIVQDAEEEKLEQYKRKNEKYTQELLQKLNSLKKNFHNYKVKKERELKRIKKRLKSTKKHLNQTIKNLKYTQEKNNVLKKKFKRKKPSIKHKRIIVKKHSIQKKNIKIKIKQAPLLSLPDVSRLSWIEIEVEDNIDIYQLALRYYGQKKEYRYIYAANRDIIPKNLKIINGMYLKIPINSSFREQPIFLNSH